MARDAITYIAQWKWWLSVQIHRHSGYIPSKTNSRTKIKLIETSLNFRMTSTA